MKERNSLFHVKFRLPGIVILFAALCLGTYRQSNAQSIITKINSITEHRIYGNMVNPSEHPDYNRYHVKPPDWDTFGNRTLFKVAIKNIEIKNDSIFNYIELIEKYNRTFELGDYFRPHIKVLFTKNLEDLADEIKRRDLFIGNFGNYIPGVGPGNWSNQQFKVPPEAIELLDLKLGNHFMGVGNHEQDGRYVGKFAPMMNRPASSRFDQYMNFHRHFVKLCGEQGNIMEALITLNFGHHYAKEGIYKSLGAETACTLPNDQVAYAFIRGAGKQYGIPWQMHISAWNRWGHKTYNPEQFGPGPNKINPKPGGPTKGTSLSLYKRLGYTSILYNCLISCYEASSNIINNELTPIGKLQQSTRKWAIQHGNPGAMVTPYAVMLDFFSGWAFPRHLYTENVYRVWGNLPYSEGDYLTDGILDMFYPGYQNSSYYHDESGFLTSTPYSDAVDCILSDAEGWLLDRYPVLIIGSELSGGAEIRDKLQSYAKQGGLLFITAGSLANLPGGLAGIQMAGPAEDFASGTPVKMEGKTITEDISFQLYPLELPASAIVIARCGNIPAVVEMPLGKGIVTVFASPFGISAESITEEVIHSKVDEPLLKPYPLINHVRAVLDGALSNQILFEAGEELSLITCRKKPGLYTLGICNNSFEEKPFKIESHIGPIESVHELYLDHFEKKESGYLPDGFANVDIGENSEKNIAGGDIRIFDVRVREDNAESIPHVIPPPRPKGRVLPLYNIRSIQEEILSRPTFFEHFDGVVVDWNYLQIHSKDELRKESEWINRQGLNLFVDLSPGVNLFPDIRLINNLERDYLESMTAIEDVMEKMKIIGSHNLILTLHRNMWLNFTPEQNRVSLDSTFHELCKKSKIYDINLHLKPKLFSSHSPLYTLKDAVDFIDRIDAENLHLALSTANLIAGEVHINEVAKLLEGKISMWCVSAPEFDISGYLWNTNAPIAEYGKIFKISEILSIEPDVPIVIDGIYKNHDEEYLDVRTLKNLLTQTSDK